MFYNRRKSIPRLIDYSHPLVRDTADWLTGNEVSVRGKLERLFYYVRDKILFGFPPDGDLVKASEIIRLGMGQCNTKGTLLIALCRVATIPARIHFSLVKKEIQRGLFTGIGYTLMPPLISHSWVEIEIDGKWRGIDSYISDIEFYQASKRALKEKGWDMGYSISCAGGESGADFNIEEEKFVQMGAVVEDHGVWNEPEDYYRTDKYKNRPSLLKMSLYRLMAKKINERVAHMRLSYSPTEREEKPC
jgi:hypothetical protein